jgi:hypothetical protein
MAAMSIHRILFEQRWKTTQTESGCQVLKLSMADPFIGSFHGADAMPTDHEPPEATPLLSIENPRAAPGKEPQASRHGISTVLLR